MQVGDTGSWMRTFTLDDVLRFAEFSGDQGEHHVIPDENGRIMVHGLLTATLPTRIGGQFNYIARNMNMQFVYPVYVGDTIRCDVTIVALEFQNNYLNMRATWSCRNQDGREVMRGDTSGIIRSSEIRTASQYTTNQKQSDQY